MIQIGAAVKNELKLVVPAVVSELGLRRLSVFECGCRAWGIPLLLHHLHRNAADIRLTFHVGAEVAHFGDFVGVISECVPRIAHIGSIEIK